MMKKIIISSILLNEIDIMTIYLLTDI